ncbi:MAG: DUF469 family protein [Hymenobacter sp.]|nr:MAG: DUF469 family protein [Hymenobacter sp.]
MSFAMKKRLRKKLRLREFREMGFHVRFELAANYTQEDTDSLLDNLIDFVEANGLFIGGGLNFFYVTAKPRHSVTEPQRQLLSDWLAQQPLVTELQVLPLSDAWYVQDAEREDALPHELVGRPGTSE